MTDATGKAVKSPHGYGIESPPVGIGHQRSSSGRLSFATDSHVDIFASNLPLTRLAELP